MYYTYNNLVMRSLINAILKEYFERRMATLTSPIAISSMFLHKRRFEIVSGGRILKEPKANEYYRVILPMYMYEALSHKLAHGEPWYKSPR